MTRAVSASPNGRSRSCVLGASLELHSGSIDVRLVPNGVGWLFSASRRANKGSAVDRCAHCLSHLVVSLVVAT